MYTAVVPVLYRTVYGTHPCVLHVSIVQLYEYTHVTVRYRYYGITTAVASSRVLPLPTSRYYIDRDP